VVVVSTCTQCPAVHIVIRHLCPHPAVSYTAAHETQGDLLRDIAGCLCAGNQLQGGATAHGAGLCG
jgi:hypothetical protein